MSLEVLSLGVWEYHGSKTPRLQDSQTPRLKTLLCVLDWGLGHAARSLALLDHPLLSGDEIHLASSGRAKAFLAVERPDLPLHDLPPYDVRYPTGNMPLNVALQFPRWWRTVRAEQRETAKLATKYGFDRIISDNRFGCHVPGIQSIFLTHQLHPITHSIPVSWLYRRYLHRFNAFWVPDTASRPLSGKLSLAEGYNEVSYIGPLSRLPELGKADKTLRSLSILSGPEPMRSRLESQLIETLADTPGQHHIIRGWPGAKGISVPENITVTAFADRERLAELIPRAETIICRPGYSTLMDLAATGTEARLILIPTPGQTEQAYLALSQVQGNGDRVIALAQEETAKIGQLVSP